MVENLFDQPGSSLLGVHETPEDADASDGTAWGGYNTSGAGFTSTGLQPGGYGFITFVHEIGHGLGLAHPHDHGGGSPLFPGVTNNDYSDTGDNDLNQGIFTIMSYNDGWETGLGLSPSLDYGWQAGPMAFDIAAIQYLYGANTTFHSEANSYVLGHTEGQPDLLSCIWDTGGEDGITYNGIYGCSIDLRAATLENAPGGGGYVSYVFGAPENSLDHWSAFTIANGVDIEDATGGSGSDYFIGNTLNNIIDGRDGSDSITYATSQYAVRIDLLNWIAVGDGGDFLVSIENAAGSSHDDLLRGSRDENVVTGGYGDDKIAGDAGNDDVRGGAGRDQLSGGQGDDTVNGGTENDTLYGGAGADIFKFDPAFGNDTIADFRVGVDKIDLSATVDDEITDLAFFLVNGNDTLVGTNEGNITLLNVRPEQLHASDFIF